MYLVAVRYRQSCIRRKLAGAAATSQQQRQQKLRLQLHVKLATGDFREIYALFCLGDTWNINSR